jgi:16S rRNA (cytosine967-C5)-methyltransferase
LQATISLLKMNFFESYLRGTISLVQSYDGKIPLAAWLKNYFAQHKKYGSTDRKQLSQLCFSYYRLGGAFRDLSHEKKICIAIFLCNTQPNDFLQFFQPRWNEHIGLDLDEKLLFLGYSWNVLSGLFPWETELSEGIEIRSFTKSFLQQPDLFIRIRPGFESTVRRKLKQSGIFFREVNSSCLALNNGTKLEAVLSLNKEYVIQDYSSQRVGEFFSNGIPAGHASKVWDCCAGSGGKSLMAHDLFPQLDLTVSDKRKSILVNLKKRFAEAGIPKYFSFVADLSAPLVPPLKGRPAFDLILVDAPCSGSGVWSRTPEQMVYFDETEIAMYNELQEKIISTVIPYLKKGGLLYYITCSVFKKENEGMANFISGKLNLKLKNMDLLKGYDQKADSMFVAGFQL